jgi:transcriptional regulator with XRE-family HTH domain
MRTHKLPNYLLAHRKRAGLSHEEVAFLLGQQCASHVSRYERFNRAPDFHKALAFCVIFRVQIHELFCGEYQKVEQIVCDRAQRLAVRLAAQRQDALTIRKLAFLKAITPVVSDQP